FFKNIPDHIRADRSVMAQRAIVQTPLEFIEKAKESLKGFIREMQIAALREKFAEIKNMPIEMRYIPGQRLPFRRSLPGVRTVLKEPQQERNIKGVEMSPATHVLNHLQA